MKRSKFKAGDIVIIRSIIYMFKSLDALEEDSNNFILSAFFALGKRNGKFYKDYTRTKFPISKHKAEKYLNFASEQDKELLLSRIRKEQPDFDFEKLENDNAVKQLSEINQKMDRIIDLLEAGK